MTRRDFLKISGLTLAATALGAKETLRPNLLLVFPDQFRAKSLGFMGVEPVKTPRLDAFAATAHTFTQAVSNYPVCSPFRAILMSGALPWVSGVTHNCVSTDAKHGPELRTDVRCWSDVLHEAGYKQAYIGKWHLDAPHKPWIECANNRGERKWNEWCPPDRRHGFDLWYSYGTYDYHMRPMYWETSAPRSGYKFVDQWGPEHEADKAIEYLQQAKGQGPFALVVSMNPPHPGYTMMPDKLRAVYAGMDVEPYVPASVPPKGTRAANVCRQMLPYYWSAITGIDTQFGRILDTLDATGLAQNTIVIFFSDHGNSLGEHNLEGKNNPYEAAMRIPYMIRWPGKIAPALDGETLADAFDLAPTILSLLGQSVPATMIGRDLSPVLLGTDAPAFDRKRAQLYYHLAPIAGGDAIADLVTLETPTQTLADPGMYGRRGLRDERYTVVFECNGAGQPLRASLYDRVNDPDQLKNIVSTAPAQFKAARETLRQRLQATQDPFAALL